MKFHRVSLRLSSERVASHELERLVGFSATSVGDQGEFMSQDNPRSQVRTRAHALYSAGDDLTIAVAEQLGSLEPILERIAGVSKSDRPDDLAVNVIVSVDASTREVALSRDFIALSERAGASVDLWINSY